MSAHINVVRRATLNTEKSSKWSGLESVEAHIKGKVSYGECSLLTNILSRPGEIKFIPNACQFEEHGNIGRIHGMHHNQGVYAFSRRVTKSIAPPGVTAEYPDSHVHHKDAPQSGEITLKECHILASHLQNTFGVTNLLPASCTTMLDNAQDLKK
mmetsp:Transcript_65037/g.89392  ORF Transcript_65037/g.89392 Transcript_65037/m.89392 type:complete len:155 (-) Transcript_65037:470-934(-)|eukprot:CAMPEP_0185767150 /NCGR_PEP_ID=MMETSP1174-20130828/41775_1 /TAXON_ID=35687 /ORGANISM="Dictyocha speculum, Strain CCMP1381" /LENGTH=154 /DNA_ID=CAMNT_0028451207 /DNA_START=52 /DNA_END=516 /DNA_ORIENTATION=+